MRTFAPRVPTVAWVVLAALLLQWPLAFNPGYFSHDELQWAAFADGDLLAPWRDVAAFQYRPLTFSLWMLLSRLLFDTPVAFHAVLVAWGSLHAGLLFAIGRRFGMPPWPAAAGACRCNPRYFNRRGLADGFVDARQRLVVRQCSVGKDQIEILR